MFDPDKLTEFLKKNSEKLADAVEKGNARSFAKFFDALKEAGAFNNTQQGNANQGHATNEKAAQYVFGKNYQKLRMNVKGFEDQLSTIEKLFNSRVLRMFGPLRQILNSTTLGGKFNNFMDLKKRTILEKEAMDRLLNQENKLGTLRMIRHKQFQKAWKEGQGNLDKQLNAETKYLSQLDKINKKLADRKKLGGEIAGLKAGDDAKLAVAKSAFYRQLLKDGAKAVLFAMALQLATGYRELRIRGEGGTQAIKNVGRGFVSQLALLGSGVFATNSDVTKNIGQLGNDVGTINVNKDLARNSTFLTEHMRLSTEQAGRLNSLFYRMSGFSGTMARNMTNVAVNMAYKNFYPPGTLLREMAENTEVFARHASRGVESFARGEMLTRRMGTNIKSMEGFADRLVGDFENSLRIQAQLQTYMPDFNMAEIMFASQFGTTEDVTKAVRTQMKGRDISKMPRSFQTAIQSATGLSFSEMQGFNKGSEYADVKGGASDKFDVTRAFVTSVADFISANARVITALTFLAWAAQGAASRLGFGGGLIGTVGKGLGYGMGALGIGMAGYGAYGAARAAGHGTGGALAAGIGTAGAGLAGGLIGQALIPIPGLGFMIGAGLGSLAGGMIANQFNAGVKHSGGMVGAGPTRSVSSMSFMGAGRFHSGLLPNEFPTILQRGEAVLTNRHQRQIATVTGVALDAAKAGEALNKGYEGQMYNNGNANMEALLRQLISQVAKGQVIEMSGKKVGGSIVNAYSRDV